MKSFVVLNVLVALALFIDAEPKPSPGVVLSGGKITRILDGDTIEVEFRRRVRVRFLDCWAPETHKTKHPSEKALGLVAKETLEGIAPVRTEVTLRVATDGDDDIGDGLTFGRVVGDVWAGEELGSLSDRMNQTGKTYRTKAELEAFLTEKDAE